MSKLDTELISQADYARHRGCSREAVRKAVQSGRITVFGPEQRVNAGLADSQWAQNTRPRIRPAHEAPQSPGAGPAEPRPNGAPAYDESRARREHADATLAELKLQRELGTLWERTDVVRMVSDLVARFRASLDNLPDQAAPVLAACGADEGRIRAELFARVESIRQELWTNFTKLTQHAPAAGETDEGTG